MVHEDILDEAIQRMNDQVIYGGNTAEDENEVENISVIGSDQYAENMKCEVTCDSTISLSMATLFNIQPVGPHVQSTNPRMKGLSPRVKFTVRIAFDASRKYWPK